uniref:SJCHGC09752 protein n=1 Tax=Schistosoma japonicum TaxID=6182 RepID=Q5BQZ1_SCHJA|nr:SJCHGC09752 protein [Schistosoma japonicum]
MQSLLNVHLVLEENLMELVRETNRNVNCNSCMFRSKFMVYKSMFNVVLDVKEYIIHYHMTHDHSCTKSLRRCDPWFRR